MRRRLSWAVLGTSGVLAVVVATMANTGEPEQVASPKIIVPMADDVVIDLPQPATTRPSTVFIDVPPVAVTSETVVPAPPPVAAVQPTVAAPKKAVPTTKPVVPVPVAVPTVKVPPVVPPQPPSQSFWDMYAACQKYYGGGYYGGGHGGGYYGGNGYYGGGYYGGGR